MRYLKRLLHRLRRRQPPPPYRPELPQLSARSFDEVIGRLADAYPEQRRRILADGDSDPDRCLPVARELTADHVVSVSGGGEGGPLRVLCASCNKRRGGEQRARIAQRHAHPSPYSLTSLRWSRTIQPTATASTTTSTVAKRYVISSALRLWYRFSENFCAQQSCGAEMAVRSPTSTAGLLQP